MSRVRQAIGPAYLFACIVMGGSAQGIITNLGLQLVAIAILARALLSSAPIRAGRFTRQLGWIAGLAIALIAVQLIPIPPSLWSAIPGRQFIVAGFRLLGQAPGWMPISMAPSETIATAMALLPPLALFCLIVHLDAARDGHLLVAILAATVISVALGVYQLRGNGMEHYLYPLSSWKTAPGLFANINHMATLLLISIPSLVALAVRRWREAYGPNDRMLTLAMAGGMAVVLAIGVAINHSSALLIIGPPVLGASVLLLLPADRIRMGRVAAVFALLLFAGASLLATTTLSGRNVTISNSLTIRAGIWEHSVRAIADHGLVGTGVGTFAKIYPLYEDPARVDRTYINHAHNDYLEFALEAGIPGIVLMLSFLAWWVRRAIDIWGASDGSEVARAACIASGAILLHSLVDYPLRTAAIAACMATMLALMGDAARRRPLSRPADLRPVRHLTL